MNNILKEININKIDEILKDIELIDIREEFEYELDCIEGSKNIPMNELLSNPKKYLNPQKEYYIMCQHAVRSERACSYLSSAGYKVINVAGGMAEYKGINRF